MANMRRANRKTERKSRKAERKSRKASRKANRKSRKANRRNNMLGGRRGIFGAVYSPVSHLLQATGEAVGTVTNTTRNVLQRGVKGVNSIGRSVTGHANAAIRGIGSRKASRKANRKNRKANRK